MRKSRAKRAEGTHEWPAVVYFRTFGLAILAYVIARIGLAGWPQPYDWLTGLVGGSAGIGPGWLRFRWRGDVFQ